MKILLVEDDTLIAEPLAKALADQHYVVDVATDGQIGSELLASFTYDLILLDVMLPKLDGISLCRQLRSQGNQTPILLLTAQNANTVMGLDAGADDYVAKPFNLQELLARIRALLRRGNTALPPLLEWQNLKLDPSLCEVTCDRQLVRLTPKEYSLLELLLRNPHRIFNSSALIDQIWSFEEPPTEDTIRSHVKGLRQKLKAAGVAGDPIETVYGIGYRLRPAEEKPQSAKEQRSKTIKEQELQRTAASSEAQTTNGIIRIWQQVKETVDRRVTVLEQAVTLLLHNQLSDELRRQAEQEAHKLAGSLGMFGADESSRLAQEIEPLFERGRSLNLKQKQYLAQLVTALRQELPGTTSEQLAESRSTNEPDELGDLRPWLLIVSPDRPMAEQLAAEASRWGMRSQHTANPMTARAQISEKRPDIVLLYTASASTLKNNTLENNLMLMGELNAHTPPVPVLVLTEQDCLIDRVKVARLGGRGVLQQPVTATQVLEAANQVLQQSRPTQAMVMVVDDDPQILTALQRLLIPWGLQVLILDNPLRFLETLEATRPDLLILDVEMPQVNGIELCQVARNDSRWADLPILFLTAHADAETMHRVFVAGADDYVCKPIVGPELVTRIFNRLERSRLLRSFAEIDALTGVANRRKSTQALTEFLQWCRHCQQPFCFALLQLNYLKQINQQYGHAAGDQVLARFGEQLRQTFRGEVVVGRWGGAEFVVGMAGITREEVVQRLANLQKAWQQFEFQATNGTSFRATFCASVAQYPQDGADLQALYQAAYVMLRQDRNGGDYLS